MKNGSKVGKPATKKAPKIDAFPVRKFIPGLQSRAGVSLIFAFAFSTLEQAKAMLLMLNRQGRAFADGN